MNILSLCKLFKKIAFQPNIIIDIEPYKRSIVKQAKSLAEYTYNDNLKMKDFEIDYPKLRNDLKQYNVSNDIVDKLFHCIEEKDSDGVFEISHNALSENIPRIPFETQMYVYDIYKLLSKSDDDLLQDKTIEELEEEYFKSSMQYIDETISNMDVIKSYIEQAIQRIPAWNNSTIVIQPNTPSKESETLVIDDAVIYIGNNKSAYFSFFNMEGKIIIDDVLESSDEDVNFFDSSETKMDYFNLIAELKYPNSTNKTKIITLYTARPRKDRDLYLDTAAIPPNLFFTNKLYSAEGLAIDLSFSDTKRDVWKVRIDKRYLIETLNTGSEKQYQAIGSKPIPIQSMILIIPSEKL